MGNVITIPRGKPMLLVPSERKAAAERMRRLIPNPLDRRCGKAAQQADRTTLRRNVTTERAPEPCSDVREILRENAQLRADYAILQNKLKVYQMRYGELS